MLKYGRQYVGSHIGFGRTFRNVDIYGKYLWTHRSGDSVTLTTGDLINFRSIDSHRLRFGARLNVNDFVTKCNPCESISSASASRIFRPYIGGYYEYEFAGTSRATAYGLPIEAPSLRGSTASGEIGIHLLPSSFRNITAEVGIQGFTGKREGVAFTGQVGIKF